MRHALLICALLAAPAAAMADSFSYTYVDGRYVSVDADAASVNGEGGVLTGSYALPAYAALPEIFYLSGSVSGLKSQSFTSGGVRGSFQSYAGSLRLGAHHAITPVLDLIGNAGAIYGELKGKGGFSGSDNSTGYVGELGLRMALIPQLELSGLYDYTHVFGNSSSDFTANLEYKATSHISAVVSADFGRSADGYGFGARYNF